MDIDEIRSLAKMLSDQLDNKYSADTANKWEGGTMTFSSGDGLTKDHVVSIDTFMQKITRVREALRVLEQQINNNKNLSDGEKLKYQGYITKAYGSMTSFNFLFKNDEDKF
jgi:hypothetical protein